MSLEIRQTALLFNVKTISYCFMQNPTQRDHVEGTAFSKLQFSRGMIAVSKGKPTNQGLSENNGKHDLVVGLDLEKDLIQNHHACAKFVLQYVITFRHETCLRGN